MTIEFKNNQGMRLNYSNLDMTPGSCGSPAKRDFEIWVCSECNKVCITQDIWVDGGNNMQSYPRGWKMTSPSDPFGDLLCEICTRKHWRYKDEH